MPGLAAVSNRISRSVSVTAERMRLATTFGSSSSSISPLGALGALAHLRRRLLQVVDLRRRLDDVRLGHHDRVLAEAAVQALREVPRELEVLTLVLTDGHQVRAVQQDVRRHEHRT